MPLIGFSTGAIARSDWRTGVEAVQDASLRAVELSALRIEELAPLVTAVDEIDVSMFEYVSVHLPSKYLPADEQRVLASAAAIAARGWFLVLHPDVVVDWEGWRSFGPLICIENMDKRRPRGGTASALDAAFQRLPDASFCFDYGHARQVDPTMSHAIQLLAKFGHRLQQIHFSDVDSSNRHRQLNRPALRAFRKVQRAFAVAVPVILETPVTNREMAEQIALASEFFSPAAEPVCS